MSDAERQPSFPPAVPQHVVDYEARSRINALETDMRGLRNQVDAIEDDVRLMRENQSSMQASLSSANTSLDWLRKFHEHQEKREKVDKAKSSNENKIAMGLIGIIVILAEVVQHFATR